MSDPVSDGFKIYQHGNVKFIKETMGLYEFDVTGSKPKKGGERPVYYVTIKDGVGYCNTCWPFKRNLKKEDGIYICKHICSCFYKLAEIKGVNQQVNLGSMVSSGFSKPTTYPELSVKIGCDINPPNAEEALKAALNDLSTISLDKGISTRKRV